MHGDEGSVTSKIKLHFFCRFGWTLCPLNLFPPTLLL